MSSQVPNTVYSTFPAVGGWPYALGQSFVQCARTNVDGTCGQGVLVPMSDFSSGAVPTTVANAGSTVDIPPGPMNNIPYVTPGGTWGSHSGITPFLPRYVGEAAFTSVSGDGGYLIGTVVIPVPLQAVVGTGTAWLICQAIYQSPSTTGRNGNRFSIQTTSGYGAISFGWQVYGSENTAGSPFVDADLPSFRFVYAIWF